MRWAALAAVLGLLLVAGCGDTGASKEELGDAYSRGYEARETAGLSQAESDAEEEFEAGYESGLSDGEEEAFGLAEEAENEVTREFEREELNRQFESEEAQLEAEDAAREAEEANEVAEEYEEEAERERRCELYDYCAP